MTSETSEIIVGIDLGTTNSCISYWSNNNLQIIPDSNGNNTIPSVVSFTNNSRYIGFSAKNQLELNPNNTFYEVKRLIGRKYDDPAIDIEKQFLPYEIHSNDNNIMIKTNNLSKRKPLYTPEEISAMVLSELKNMAESHLNMAISKAVITVPAYFNDSQRQATKDAATIAGLECVRMINEPTAAALSYGFEKKSQLENRDVIVLVYDLGGGTMDVSLLNICEGSFHVLASTGNTHLGGADFDNRLISYCINTFKKKHNITDEQLNVSSIALQKLRAACENAKKIMSSSKSATIAVQYFHEDINLVVRITRKEYEKLCMDLFILCLNPVEEVLKSCNMEKDEVNEIVLVGGMSRDPLIRKNLSLYFLGKEPNSSINPDEVVAMGAAIQGYILCDKNNDTYNAFSDNFTLLDIIPLSLGVETIGGIMDTVIPRNTIIPTKKKKRYTTDADYETSVNIKIYEGERKMTKDNFFVGEFILDGLEEAPRGIAEIDISFCVDTNGIISVIAEDRKNEYNHKSITIQSNKGRLSMEKINELVVEAKEMELMDKIEKERKQYYYEIDDVCSNIMTNLNLGGNSMNKKDKDNVIKEITKTMEWLKKKDYMNRDKKDYIEVLSNIKKKYGTLSLKVSKEEVKGKAEDVGTTVYGNEEDDEDEEKATFELINKNKYNDADYRNELKQHRTSLIELCNSILDVLQDDLHLLVDESTKNDIKDFIDDTLLWIHVESKITIQDYNNKTEELNAMCNKMLDDDKNIKDNSNLCKRYELENLCFGIKGSLSTIASKTTGENENIEELHKIINETLEWLIDLDAKKRKAEILQETPHESPDDSVFQNKIDRLNDICNDIFESMIGKNKDDNKNDDKNDNETSYRQLLGNSVGTPLFMLKDI